MAALGGCSPLAGRPRGAGGSGGVGPLSGGRPAPRAPAGRGGLGTLTRQTALPPLVSYFGQRLQMKICILLIMRLLCG